MIKKKKTKEKKSKLLSIISLAIIVIALAITLILVQRPQETRNQAASSCELKCKTLIPSDCIKGWPPFFSYTDIGCVFKGRTDCSAKCEIKIEFKSPTPTKKPTPTRRPTSTPRPTPITCRNIGLCIRNPKQTVCPTGYQKIGPYGTDCSYKSQFCCISTNY